MKQAKITMDPQTHAKILEAKNKIGIARMDQVLGVVLMSYTNISAADLASDIVSTLPQYMEAVAEAEKPEPRKRKSKGKGTA